MGKIFDTKKVELAGGDAAFGALTGDKLDQVLGLEGVGGEGYDRAGVALAAQDLGRLDAVHLGHAHVHQDQVVRP